MMLKEILVLLDKTPQVADRLDLVIDLAKQHGANIIGLHVITHSLFERKQAPSSDTKWELQQLFEEKTSRAGVAATWQSIDAKGGRGTVAEIVNHHACFTDLVVVGQGENGSKDKGHETDVAERVVLGAGRPVLIVPYTGTFKTVGERTLVAWKSGHASARAIHDALPMLKGSRQVNVFEVNPSELERDDVERLCNHLASHEVQARAEASIVTELSIGDVLLNRVADEGSDLLVMGAYAHSHFGATALGDVARHVLKHMTVPVLMSH